MKTAYILRGLSGSGKSYFAKSLAPEDCIFSTDRYFVRDGVYHFEPARLGINHDLNFKDFEEACWLGKPSVVCDNTNALKRHFSSYQVVAVANGYKVEIIMVGNLTDLDLYAQRNKHGLTRAMLERQAKKFEL